jgi:hypothetical protein
MKVEITAGALRHYNIGSICEFMGRRPWLEPKCKPAIARRGLAVNILHLGTAIRVLRSSSDKMCMMPDRRMPCCQKPIESGCMAIAASIPISCPQVRHNGLNMGQHVDGNV